MTKINHRTFILILAGAFIFSAVFLGWAVYDAKPPRAKQDPLPNHVMPYVDGQEAVQQVENFYQSYLSANPKLAANKKKTVEIFGSKNLEFYYEYYQHGFDPIICSTVLPIKVSSFLEASGPTAIIKTIVEHSDGTREEIKAVVVLNDEGMEIDSITCPGEKGNLPPER